MFDQFREDSETRPDLFIFCGKIDQEKLDAWLSKREFVVPEDLKTFSAETGGCYFFENRSHSWAVRTHRFRRRCGWAQ